MSAYGRKAVSRPVLTFRLQIFRSSRYFELSVVSSGWSEVRCGLSPDRPEYLSDDSRRRAGRILPDLLLFLGDGEEKAIERFARNVVLQLRVLFLDQAELRSARGDLVVLLGELHLCHRFLDDRLKPPGKRLGSRALEVLGRRVLAAREDAFRVLHAHSLHRIDEQGLRFGHSGLG